MKMNYALQIGVFLVNRAEQGGRDLDLKAKVAGVDGNPHFTGWRYTGTGSPWCCCRFLKKLEPISKSCFRDFSGIGSPGKALFAAHTESSLSKKSNEAWRPKTPKKVRR
jgi:hypothetical protein